MRAKTIQEDYLQDEKIKVDKYTPTSQLIHVIGSAKNALELPKSTQQVLSISPKQFRKARVKALGLLRSRGFSRDEIQKLLTEGIGDLLSPQEEFTTEKLDKIPLVDVIKMTEGAKMDDIEGYGGEDKMGIFTKYVGRRIRTEGTQLTNSYHHIDTWDTYTLWEIPGLKFPQCVMIKQITKTRGSAYSVKIVVAKKKERIEHEVDWDATRQLKQMNESALFPSTKLKKDKMYILYNWDNEKPTQIKIKDINQASDEVTFIAPGDETVESWFNISKIDNISDSGKIILKESVLPDVAEDHPWNKIYSMTDNMIWNGRINNEDQLKTIIDLWVEQNKYGLSADDIEDAAWAAWSDKEF